MPKTAGEALAVAARRQTAEGLGTAAALLRGHSGTLAQATFHEPGLSGVYCPHARAGACGRVRA